MTIHIDAADVYDASRQIGISNKRAEIRILWRDEDFGRNQYPGCIVDATSVAQIHVPMEFESAGKALRYLARLLLTHDKHVKAEQKRIVKEARKAKK